MDCPLVFANLSEAAANLKRRPIEVIKIELRKVVFHRVCPEPVPRTL